MALGTLSKKASNRFLAKVKNQTTIYGAGVKTVCGKSNIFIAHDLSRGLYYFARRVFISKHN